MPKQVRNFWTNIEIDGSTSQISGGPRNKEGGFYQRIYIRDAGTVKTAFTIQGYAAEDGTLKLNLFGEDGVILHSITSAR